MNKYWHRNAAPRAHPGRREIGTSPTPLPICTGPTRRLPGREHWRVPPCPPYAGRGDRGRNTLSPLWWSQLNNGGVAAGPAGPRARRAARGSAEGAESAIRARRAPGSEVAGARAARRAGARRRRRAHPWRGEDDRIHGGRGEGDQGSEPGPRARHAERRGAGREPGRAPVAAPHASVAE